MQPDARVGDIAVGTCPAHESPKSFVATIVAGSSTVLTDGQPQARLSDILVASCGHSTLIISGSTTVFTDGQPNARVGDAVSGPPNGAIVNGSSVSFSQ